MFHHLSDSELHDRTVHAAKAERGATLLLLEHLLETDRRKSYLPSFRSLWEYVEKGLGYSSEQTNERMMAFRFFKKVPEAKAAVAAETLCLTSAAKIGAVIHRENSSVDAARELFRTCEGKTTREVKIILLPDDATPKPDSVRPITKSLTLIKIEVDADFMATLERAKELSGEFEVKTLLRKTLAEFVKKREVKATAAKKVTDGGVATVKPYRSGTHAHEAIPDLPAERAIPKNRSIPRGHVREVRMRSGDRCEFASGGKRCETRAFLQFHHLNPYAFFGSHEPENLMHVCSAHHAWIERRSGGSLNADAPYG